MARSGPIEIQRPGFHKLEAPCGSPIVDDFNPELTEEGKRLGCWKTAASPYEESEQNHLFDRNQMPRSIYFN